MDEPGQKNRRVKERSGRPGPPYRKGRTDGRCGSEQAAADGGAGPDPGDRHAGHKEESRTDKRAADRHGRLDVQRLHSETEGAAGHGFEGHLGVTGRR